MDSDLEASDLPVTAPLTTRRGHARGPRRVVPIDLAVSPERLFARCAGLPGLAFLDTSAPAGRTGSEGWTVLTAFPVEARLDELPAAEIGARSSCSSGSGDTDEIPFATGWIGFASYESSSRWNPDLLHRAPAPGLPGTWWGRYAATLLYRHRDRQWLLAHRRDREGEEAAGRLLELSLPPYPRRADAGVSMSCGLTFSAGEPQAAISAEEHGRRVHEILRWIGRGHIYQANLTYPVLTPFTGSSEALLLALRTHNPAPFGAFLAPVPGLAIVSSSPELFLRVRGRRIETRPIKGTTPRHPGDPALDRLLARRLFTSAKDRAELTMIVDLERNDLGRLCRPGTIRTPAFPRVESYERVHHLAASVQGELARPLSLQELFAMTFPGGSVTGAPKIRAMEVLRDLEVAPRWVYTGTLGSLDDRGHVDLSLTIRTMWVEQDQVTFHVGGGIVADSIAESEWEETRHKAAAMLAALEAGRSALGSATEQNANSTETIRAGGPRSSSGTERCHHHVVGDR